jgi:hypothetical protein
LWRLRHRIVLRRLLRNTWKGPWSSAVKFDAVFIAPVVYLSPEYSWGNVMSYVRARCVVLATVFAIAISGTLSQIHETRAADQGCTLYDAQHKFCLRCDWDISRTDQGFPDTWPDHSAPSDLTGWITKSCPEVEIGKNVTVSLFNLTGQAPTSPRNLTNPPGVVGVQIQAVNASGDGEATVPPIVMNVPYGGWVNFQTPITTSVVSDPTAAIRVTVCSRPDGVTTGCRLQGRLSIGVVNP